MTVRVGSRKESFALVIPHREQHFSREHRIFLFSGPGRSEGGKARWRCTKSRANGEDEKAQPGISQARLKVLRKCLCRAMKD